MAERNISEERKTAYYLGMGITGLGIVLIIVGFITFAALGMRSVHSGGQSASPFIGFFMFFAGGVLAVAGNAVRTAAAKGLAGSGLKLDPEQARKDVEPWSRMAGGIVKDAIDETGLMSNQGHSHPQAEHFEDRLAKLHQLHRDGALTDEEYERAKARVMEQK